MHGASLLPGPSPCGKIFKADDAPFWTMHADQAHGTDEKKAHHAVRSNLPRFRLLGSASNIL